MNVWHSQTLAKLLSNCFFLIKFIYSEIKLHITKNVLSYLSSIGHYLGQLAK